MNLFCRLGGGAGDDEYEDDVIVIVRKSHATQLLKAKVAFDLNVNYIYRPRCSHVSNI